MFSGLPENRDEGVVAVSMSTATLEDVNGTDNAMSIDKNVRADEAAAKAAPAADAGLAAKVASGVASVVSAAAAAVGADSLGPHADGPRLLADVGGTNARFALERGPGDIGPITVYACADFPGIAEAITQFFRDSGVPVASDATTGAPSTTATASTPAASAGGAAAPIQAYARVLHAAIAIANPIDGDQVTMTNHDWRFSIAATREALGLQTLKVVNDFTALAQAVPALKPHQVRQVGGGAGHPSAVRTVLGAGTGLGVAGLVCSNDRWIPISSEGGHASFAPIDAREDAILAFARHKWGHVSFERVASGPGIELIYAALADEQQRRAAIMNAGDVKHVGTPCSAEIVKLADGGDPLALETVEVFCGILGSFAGNVAITFGAQGGVYLGGGVVPKLGERFYTSSFRQRFEQKGRFVRYLANIPTFVITAENPAFIGASEILSATLAS